MNLYEQGFAKYDLTAAQVLLTEEDFSSRKRYLNLRHTLTTLLDMGVIPVINENDTVSTTELEVTDRSRSFGDNDKLSALVMSKLEAHVLILLSDVDGLFTDNPKENPDAEFISEVQEITAEIEAVAGRQIRPGRGGMATKLQAARIAMNSGGIAIIANGLKSGILGRVLRGERRRTLVRRQNARRFRKSAGGSHLRHRYRVGFTSTKAPWTRSRKRMPVCYTPA